MKKNRTLKFVFFALLAVFISSCEQQQNEPRFEEMVAYHAESLNLAVVNTDSVTRFSQKVDAFVEQHPAAKYDPLYPEIIKNIQQNRLRITIEIDTAWAGETHIYF